MLDSHAVFSEPLIPRRGRFSRKTCIVSLLISLVLALLLSLVPRKDSRHGQHVVPRKDSMHGQHLAVHDSTISLDSITTESDLKLRLSYLPFRAMAETTRFILKYGGIEYQDELVWGREFQHRREEGSYPFDKVPIIVAQTSGGKEIVIAQSGSIARFVAKLAKCYPEDPVECAFNDAVFEMGQELCSINPLINCYVGSQFQEVKRWYFDSLPDHLSNLERQLCISKKRNGDKPFFGGAKPSHADFNLYHHVSNARLVEPQCVDRFTLIGSWAKDMEGIPSLKKWLDERPTLVGIGTDPGLKDKTGQVINQRDPRGHAFLVDGVFKFADNPSPR